MSTRYLRPIMGLHIFFYDNNEVFWIKWLVIYSFAPCLSPHILLFVWFLDDTHYNKGHLYMQGPSKVPVNSQVILGKHAAKIGIVSTLDVWKV